MYIYWTRPNCQGVDQLAECIRKIKEDPTVRTHSDADGHDDFFQGQIGCFFFYTNNDDSNSQ